MTEEDKDLEILKAKRLVEMQKNLSLQEKQKKSEQESKNVKTKTTGISKRVAATS